MRKPFNFMKHPPGGWLFKCRVGSKLWHAPHPMHPFADVAASIVTVHQNNGLPLSHAQARDMLEEYTRARMGWDVEIAPGSGVLAPGEKGCRGCGAKRK